MNATSKAEYRVWLDLKMRQARASGSAGHRGQWQEAVRVVTWRRTGRTVQWDWSLGPIGGGPRPMAQNPSRGASPSS